MADVNWKKTASFVLLPQIVPRLQSLFFSGFSFIAFFMAQTFRAAQLLPHAHPYLSSANIGRYGIRHVMIEAGSNLKMRFDHIDQILIFGFMILGLGILAAQILLLVFSLAMQSAHAGALPTGFEGFVGTPNAQDDIAFVLMDRVFGIPNFFTDIGGGGTCVANSAPCFNPDLTADGTYFSDYDRSGTVTTGFPWPIHEALRGMFQFYSVGLLVVAVMIFIYFIGAIVLETAQSGTPFGRRFNQVWAPIRMVVALGLLIPVSNGLNSAQYILMYAAKWGSGFATNGWILFLDTALAGGATPAGATNTLVARPNTPPVDTLLEFMTVVAACKHAYEVMYHPTTVGGTTRRQVEILAYLVDGRSGAMAPTEIQAAGVASTFVGPYFQNGDIKVVFGERHVDHQSYTQQVAPLCGELRLQVTDTDFTAYPGNRILLDRYFATVERIWTGILGATPGCAYAGTGITLLNGIGCTGANLASRYLPINNDPTHLPPTTAEMTAIRDFYQTRIDTAINDAMTAQQGSPEWAEDFRRFGWAGAAIWYNKIAQLNGAMTGGAYSLPFGMNYPLIMQEVMDNRSAAEGQTGGAGASRPSSAADAPIELADPTDTHIARVMFQARSLWEDNYSGQQPTNNVFIDTINMIFGTQGLFNIHENANLGIHPLAQLVAIGKGILDSSIRNLGIAAGAGIAGGAANLLSQHAIGSTLQTASGFFLQVATIGLAIGFVLFYIIPFLPFIYFFFAVGGWVKGIFEAMVGVPLWALAHIRIDGNGLPGDAAMGGYYLILEIFLRPILIIFGFLASITIFAAQVQVLHQIWELVVSNAAGFDPTAAGAAATPTATGGAANLRNSIDELFFTVIYAIIVYMLGMASFKLIDLIPNHILRWMGASVSTFGDQSGDPAENLVRNSFIGGQMIGGQVQGAVGGATGAFSQGAAAVGGGARNLGEGLASRLAR